MRKRWEIKPIGDVCDLMTGGTPSKTRREYFNGGKIKWLVSGDIHQKEITECDGRITELGLENSNAKYLPINSVLIALNGQGKTRGTVAILRTKATCNQSLVSITPKDDAELLPEYIYCYLHGKYEEIRKMTGDSGNDRRGLNMPLIRSISIPIPPLPEQKQIVAILDKAFAAIDRAKAIAEQNLRNARELFDGYLNEIFTKKGEDWEEMKMEEVCIDMFAGGDAPKENYSKEISDKFTIPIYANAVADNGLYGYTDKPRVFEPSVTIAARGSGTGHTEIRTVPFFPIVRLIVLTPDTSKIHLEFLKYSIDNLVISKSGSAIPQLTIPMIKSYSIALPPLKTQGKIIQQAKSLSAQTQQFEKIYQQKINNLEELKKSILQRAFAGELTANNQAVPA